MQFFDSTQIKTNFLDVINQEINLDKSDDFLDKITNIFLMAVSDSSCSEASEKCMEAFTQLPKDDVESQFRFIMAVAKAGFLHIIKSEAEALLKATCQQKKWTLAIELQALLGPEVAADNKKNTALCLIVEHGTDEEIDLACTKLYSCVNTCNSTNNTPLHIATIKGNGHAIESLLKAGALIDATDNFGRTSLHLAALKSQTDAAIILINNKSDVCAVNKNGNTPLHLACFTGLSKLIKILVDNGADINSKGSDGATPLHKCLKGGQNVLEELSKLNPDYEIRNADGKTAFEEAMENQLDIAEFFFKKMSGSNSSNPLWLKLNTACIEKPQTINEVLNENDINQIDINQIDNEGKSWLHYTAVDDRLIPLTKLLIEKGANQNIQDIFGRTPLFAAVKFKQYQTALTLLISGAKVDVFDFCGTTPYFLLMKSGQALWLNGHFEIFDKGLTKEIIDRKFLAHQFSVKGTFYIKGEKMRYEGLYREISARKFAENVHSYYTQFLDEQNFIKSVQWQNIQARLSKETTAEIESLQPQIFEILQRSKDTINNLTNFQKQSVEDVLERNKDNLPSVISTGWYKHSLGVVLYKEKIAICNRGAGAEQNPGIVINTIGQPQNLHSAMEECTRRSTQVFFKNTIIKLLDLKDRIYIPQKPLKAGNCSVANSNSMELALLYLQFEEIMSSTAAKELSRAIKQGQRIYSKERLLNTYLTRHTKHQTYPADRDLLNLIYEKCNSESVFHKTVRQAIDDWLANG